jgi:hypothetical protein
MMTLKNKIRVIPSNVYLVEILKPIAYLSLDKYIQEASYGPGERFYINRGSAKNISISAKNVDILAQNLIYLKNNE